MKSKARKAWMVMAFAVGLGMMWPGAARAEEDAPFEAAVTRVFKEGVALLKAGKFEEARVIFLQSLALEPGNPKVLSNLAIAEYGSGHFVEGMKHIKEYKASPRAEWNKDKELKQRLYDDLWAATGHLKITADSGVEVLVDGTKQGKAPLADTVDTKPGNHYVAAGAKNAEVTVAAGETKEVNLATPPKAPAAVPPAATQATPPPPMPEPPPMDSESGEGSTRYLVSGSLVALGVVGVGLGIGYTVAANNASRNAKDLASGSLAYSCYNSSTPNCNSRVQYLRTRTHDRNIATGSFISGGVLVAAGVISYLIWPKESSHSMGPPSSASVVPWVGKDGVGLAYGKEF